MSRIYATFSATKTARQFRIGAELNLDDVDLSVVSMPYESGGGRLGLLGPMRMDYRRAIKIVEEIGEGLADSLGS